MGTNMVMIWYFSDGFFLSLDISVHNFFITNSLNVFFSQTDSSGYGFDRRTICQEPEHQVPLVKGQDFQSRSLIVQFWFMQ